MKVSDVDWKNWEPEELSTIMFVVEESRVLLIHKKRGLGAGKINGPGGKIEKGETAYDQLVQIRGYASFSEYKQSK